MINLEFNFKDVFRAPRLGFSTKKIAISVIGFYMALIGYAVFSYLAFLTSGFGFREIWRTFRYIPYPTIGINLAWYSWILWIIGAIWAVISIFIIITAISKITFESLRGDEFYEMKESLKFAFKNLNTLVLTPFTLIVFIAVLLFIGIFMGLVGRIPYFGQMFIGLMGLFLFLGALLVVYLIIVLGTSLITTPTIVAVTKNDTFDTLFEVFSVLNDRTWDFLAYNIFLAFLVGIGTSVFYYFMTAAIKLTHWALSLWQGPRGWWETIFNNGLAYLPDFLRNGAYFGRANWAEIIGAFLMGLCFYTLFFIVAGYGISIFSAGETIIYTILVKRKDERNLLEEKEEEEEEEELKEEKLSVEEPKKKTTKTKTATKKTTKANKTTKAKKATAKTKTKKDAKTTKANKTTKAKKTTAKTKKETKTTKAKTTKTKTTTKKTTKK